MKPIEPGCLVVILRGNMANRVGVATEYVPANQEFERHPDKMTFLPKTWRFSSGAWEVDVASDPDCLWVIAESNLMRIDGGDAELFEQAREVEHG